MACLGCELDRCFRSHQLRSIFDEVCRRHLKLYRPPRGSYCRWLLDVLSQEEHSVRWNSFLHKPTQHRDDLIQRIMKGGVTQELFFDFIDDLPTPLMLPRLRVISSMTQAMEELDSLVVNEDLVLSTALSIQQCLPLTNVPPWTLDQQQKVTSAIDWASAVLDAWTAHCSAKRYGTPNHYVFARDSLKRLPIDGNVDAATVISPVTLRHLLRHVRRPVVLARFGIDVLEACQELERAFVVCQQPSKKQPYCLEPPPLWSPVFDGTFDADSWKHLLEHHDCEEMHQHCWWREATATEAVEQRRTEQDLLSQLQLRDENTDDEDNHHTSRDCSTKVVFCLMWCPPKIDIVAQVALDQSTLRKLWARYHGSSFLIDVFRLVLRYMPSSDHDDAESRGFQAALSKRLWEVLRSDVGVTTECFASPFNATLSHYFSPFPDTDCVFGSLGQCTIKKETRGGISGASLPVSLGSFFSADTQLLSGSYQVNPPFSETVLERVVRRLLAWLDTSELASLPLSFALVTPDWTHGGTCRFLDALRVSKASSFLVGEVHIPAFQHCYASYATMGRLRLTRSCHLDASLHAEPTSCHSQHFTSISPSFMFLLQTSAGREKWPVTPAVLQRLRTAWATH